MIDNEINKHSFTDASSDRGFRTVDLPGISLLRENAGFYFTELPIL